MNKIAEKVVENKFLVPFILLTSLFFLWGIANDLTNPMVSAFKKVMSELSNFESAMVQAAFYGGYATMAIPAALFIRRFSYKSGILVGLALYSIGALLFYPAASYEQFGFFLASLYILTFGLAFLETTSNPYVLSMGAKSTATRRLNLAQAFNPIGSLSGMLVAQLVVITALSSDNKFEEHSQILELEPTGIYQVDVIDNVTKDTLHAVGDPIAIGDLMYPILPEAEQAEIRTQDLLIIRNPYIGLGLLVFVIFIIIALYKKMPKKAEDEEIISIKETFRKLLANKRYKGGVLTQIFYVGAQIMCWTFIFQYVDNLNETFGYDLTATWYNMAAMVMFLVGRWICTYLLKFMNAGKLMLIFASVGILFTLGAIFIVGMGGLYCLVGISIAMSLMFPTIYGISLKDMGDEAKLGSAGLVMAIVGGALLPPLQGKILDIGGEGFSDKLFFGYIPEVNISFVLPLICLTVVAIFSYRSYKYHLKEA